jgi:hypothetical protein
MQTQQEITDLADNLSFYLARWRKYPLAFVIEAMNAREHGMPAKWQAEALANLEEHHMVAIRSGHGVGKSRFLGWVVWWFHVCMKNPGKPLKNPCTGPSGDNIEDVLWGEVQLLGGHLHPFLRAPFEINSDELYCMEERKAWFSKLRTARQENPNALAGFHGDPCLFLIDEAFGVPDEVFEVARGAMSDVHSYAIMTGNPTRLDGYAFNAFHNKRSIWHCMHVNCEDELVDNIKQYPFVHPNGDVEIIEAGGRVSPDFAPGFEDEYGRDSPVYAARVMGTFPDSETDQIIRHEWVDKCWDREVMPPVDRHRIMGVDVAYQGDDDSALVVRHGPNIETIEHWHGYDPVETAARVLGAYRDLKKGKKQVRYICIDATGIGAGVYASLRKALKDDRDVSVLPVYVAEKAPEDGGSKCRRLRDWLWWQSRLFFKDRKPRFLEDNMVFRRLAKELCSPKFKYGSTTNKIEVETKDELRKRKVKSPDFADALNLTFFADYEYRRAVEAKKRKRKHFRKQKDPTSWRTV